MLNLILHLETRHGYEIPERVLSKEEFTTVGDLATLIIQGTDAPPVDFTFRPIPEEEIDIKVHCVVSCLTAGIKTRGFDHRPFYMEVWDTGFDISRDHRLNYHAEGVTHDHFLDWFGRIYGVPVRTWYDQDADKETNIARLEDLLARRSETEHVMIMLDMFHLPERENKFNQNPFPHYVMLEMTDDPAIWFMHDPDFRWEGKLPRDAVVNAIDKPTVAGGYLYNRAAARPPDACAILDYFRATFYPERMPLLDAAARILDAHVGPEAVHPVANLANALQELPVIGIRKYAYEHGFAFFGRALGTSESVFEMRCDEIEALQQGLRRLHYLALKLAKTGDAGTASEARALVDRLWRLEHGIKAALAADFECWIDHWLPTEARDAFGPAGAV